MHDRVYNHYFEIYAVTTKQVPGAKPNMAGATTYWSNFGEPVYEGMSCTTTLFATNAQSIVEATPQPKAAAQL